MKNTPLLILVDGSSYLFRAYHALPPLTNSKGEPTGAIIGVLNMLQRLIKDFEPTYIGVVFDAPGPTFRDKIYPEYKANRSATPADLISQINPLLAIIKDMGLPLISVSGVEADDVIGTLSKLACDKKIKTIISTGDKDLAQLVNENVTLINTMTGESLDENGVKNKFHVKPEQIIDYLALVGDSADNIPGVPKCGPKTAAKWLAEYQNIDNILSNAEKIKGKVGEYLRNSIDQLHTSKILTTIKLDVDLNINPLDLTQSKINLKSLQKHYENLESKRLLSSLEKYFDKNGSNEKIKKNPKKSYNIIFDKKIFELWVEKLKKSKFFSFDTETTSLDYMNAEIVGLSFAIDIGDAAYVPLCHDYDNAPEQLDREWALSKLKPLLESHSLGKLGQNLKYDKSVLANYDIELNGILFDTMLESYINNSSGGRHDMDSLADRYLNQKTIHYEDIAGKGVKQISFSKVAIEEAGQYAAEDADITLRLHHEIWPEIDKNSRLKKLFNEIELPLLSVLSSIERTGVTIDEKMLQKQSKDLQKNIDKLAHQAFSLAGKNFNMSSPKQIGEIFYNQLELPILAKTPKGAPSTAESVLQDLADRGHELPQIILDYRGLSKLKTTYTDKLPNMINKETGRIHTSYHQAVAATGRLSSSDPNLQNIPIRKNEGRRIRKAFLPRAGWNMVAADYSQIELRIMAHLSNDKGLLGAFANNMDIHRATAAEVFGADNLDSVTDDMRRSAKAINFGLIYGMSAFGLAKQLGIDRKSAQDYVNLYFQRYPGVKEFMDQTRESAHELGYVETLFGRRLYLPNINSNKQVQRSSSERAAINAPMQGTAADIIKIAMLSIFQWLRESRLEANMLMQVHDELVFEISPEITEKSILEIRNRMENAANLQVPLLVDIGIGKNWEEAH
tara:strand:+ start:1931 stop:4642 length:2712 start_codon:yes stop_codon:yes gene_type:complete